MKKQKYDAPSLTVVTFKTERGFAESAQPIAATLGGIEIGIPEQLDIYMGDAMQQLGVGSGSGDYFSYSTTGFDANGNSGAGAGTGGAGYFGTF